MGFPKSDGWGFDSHDHTAPTRMDAVQKKVRLARMRSLHTNGGKAEEKTVSQEEEAQRNLDGQVNKEGGRVLKLVKKVEPKKEVNKRGYALFLYKHVTC